MPQVRPQKGAGDDETAAMKTRSDNSIAAKPSTATGALSAAAGDVPRSGVRAADIVKARIAATARESIEILAGRFTARRGNDLSTEELG
jgi:uncharacterized cupin superfamily protein